MPECFSKSTISLVILISAILVFVISVPVTNNSIARRITRDLLETPLPEKTIICDSLSASAKLTGSGNGMQYFGGILIHTDLTEDELNDHYSQYRISEWSYLVLRQDKTEIDVIEHGVYRFLYLAENSNFDGYYMIYTWGDSNFVFADLDLRGH